MKLAGSTVSASHPEDRRIQRSKRMLRDTLAQLIEERGLDGFSVGDLTERAGLNRGTFYAHFRDKDDLLQSLEEEVFDSLCILRVKVKAITLAEFLAAVHDGIPPRACVELFEILSEHGTLLRALLGQGGDASFQAQLRDHACTDIVRGVLYEKYTRNSTPLVEYYIAYYASAMLGLIQRWVQRDMRETPDEMARILLTIMFLKPGDPIEMKVK
jgi:AcrR family transcriptional regulator